MLIMLCEVFSALCFVLGVAVNLSSVVSPKFAELIIGALARPLGRAHWFSGVKGRALPNGRANAPLRFVSEL